MSHDLIFALCSLALLLGTIWLLIEIVPHSHGGMLSGRAVQHLIAQYLHAKPHRGAVEFGIPASANSSLGSWSRIRRAIRTRRSVRVAVR
jgi:hypothetical protein